MQNGGRRYAAGLALALVAGALLLWQGRDVLALLADRQRLQAWLAQLGPWAPLGLTAFGALQVLVAPLPGYFVQLAGGYLFGAVQGTVFGTLGMLLGAAIAMQLSRIFGRPLVVRLIGAARLDRWQTTIRADSPWTWLVLLLFPSGDIPWFLAGLARIPTWRVLALGFVTRAPTLYVVSSIGAGVTPFSGPPLVALISVIAGLSYGLYHYRGLLRETFVTRWQRLRAGKRPLMDEPHP